VPPHGLGSGLGAACRSGGNGGRGGLRQGCYKGPLTGILGWDEAVSAHALQNIVAEENYLLRQKPHPVNVKGGRTLRL
jgi:hypothetical protein